MRFTDGTQRSYDLVVGADGIHSRLRAMLFPDAPKPAFTGQGCWRAVVPRPAEIDCAHVYVGGTVKAGITPVSRDEMYLFLLQHVPDNPRMPEERWPKLLAEQLRGFGGALGAVRDGLDAILADQLPAAGEAAATAALASRARDADRRRRACDHAASGLGRGAGGGGCAGAGRGLASDIALEEALQRFTTRRYERCRMVVENSVRLGEMEMARAPAQQQAELQRASMLALTEPI